MDEFDKCPSCGGYLGVTGVYRYSDGGGSRKLGDSLFCKVNGCPFEIDAEKGGGSS